MKGLLSNSFKALTDDMLYDLENGVQLGDYLTQPTTIHLKDRHHFAMTLTEGKNRQIRRMMQKLERSLNNGFDLHHLIRSLKPGQFITVQRENCFNVIRDTLSYQLSRDHFTPVYQHLVSEHTPEWFADGISHPVLDLVPARWAFSV